MIILKELRWGGWKCRQGYDQGYRFGVNLMAPETGSTTYHLISCCR